MFFFNAPAIAGLARILEFSFSLLSGVSLVDAINWQIEACQFRDEFLDIGFDPSMLERVVATSVGRRPSPRLGMRTAALCEEMWERLRAARAAAT